VLVGALLAVAAAVAAVALHRAAPPAPARTPAAPVARATAPSQPPLLEATVTATAVPLPVPQDVRFSDVTFLPGGQDGWVVGRSCPPSPSAICSGVAYRTTDGGRSWTLAYHGKFALDHVAFVDAQHGWAWGREGPVACPGRCPTALLATRDGGQSWTQVDVTSQSVNAIAFRSPSDGLMAVGQCDTAASCFGQILATADGGRSWAPVAMPNQPVVAVAYGEGGVWALASGMAGTRHVETHVLMSADGGRTWSREGSVAIQFPPPAGQAAFTFAPGGAIWLSLFSNLSCAMHGCGTDAVYRSLDGGRTWHTVPVPYRASTTGQPCGPADMPLLAVAGDGSLIAVRQAPYAGCGPPSATLSVSTDGGATWRVRHAWSQFFVVAVSGPDWLLGPSALLHSTDGGRSWAQVLPPVHPTTAVDFLDATNGWGIGAPSDAGAVLRTAAGGASWHVLASIPGVQLTQISFVDASHGWVAGQVQPSGDTEIFATVDGGQTWRQVARLNTWAPYMRFFDMHYGVLATLGLIGRLRVTADGGRTWSVTATLPSDAHISAMALASAQDAWALESPVDDAPQVAATSDGGVTWRTVARLARGYVAGAGVAFAPPTAVWAYTDGGSVAMLSGAVFVSADAGRSWHGWQLPPALLQRPASLFALSDRDGWLLTSDGALWRTTDGAATWRELAP
jgi:photosystem II stability/assembly factor-like uncharacterized protein